MRKAHSQKFADCGYPLPAPSAARHSSFRIGFAAALSRGWRRCGGSLAAVARGGIAVVNMRMLRNVEPRIPAGVRPSLEILFRSNLQCNTVDSCFLSKQIALPGRGPLSQLAVPGRKRCRKRRTEIRPNRCTIAGSSAVATGKNAPKLVIRRQGAALWFHSVELTALKCA